MKKPIEEALRKVQQVVFNQRPGSQELLDMYEGWPSQFDLLVKIIAEV